MIHIFIRSSEKVCSQIPIFERFLETYDLKIINRTESRYTIELIVNAITIDEIKWINKLSIDFFNGEIVSLKTVVPLSLPSRGIAAKEGER
jgi:hypothetical protein